MRRGRQKATEPTLLALYLRLAFAFVAFPFIKLVLSRLARGKVVLQ
jgi:hypothetical protein